LSIGLDQGGDGLQGVAFEAVVDVDEAFTDGGGGGFDQGRARGAAFRVGSLML